jgi:flagellar motility protein MotE (MotC chaperone)
MGRERGSTLVNVLAILMLLELSGAAALAGYVVLTGKVTQEQLRLTYQVYKGEVKPEALDDAAKWKKHQEEEAEAARNKPAGADAYTKVAATGMQAEAGWLGLEWEMKRVQDRQAAVDQRMAEYELKKKELEDLEKRLAAQSAKEHDGSGAASLQKALAILKGLKPAQLKEYLDQVDDATAVTVIKGLEERTAAKVLAEYKTPADQLRRTKLLEMVRTGELAKGGSTVAGG